MPASEGGGGGQRGGRDLFIYLVTEGSQPSQLHRVTSGLFTSSNLTEVEYNTLHQRNQTPDLQHGHKNAEEEEEEEEEEEYNTKHAHYYTNVKHNPKMSPFGIAIVKKKRQIKLGDEGTIDHFGLAFQYQI